MVFNTGSLLFWITERENIRRRRAEGALRPWTVDPLPTTCNIFLQTNSNRDKGIFVATPRISCEAAERQPGGASPTSAQAVTNSASRSTAPSSSTSATGGFASCSRLRTKMLH